MHPESGVPPADARNSLPNDVEASQNCDELWYSTSRCQPRFDPAAANAMLAELINLINKGEVIYDCRFLDQVQFAVRYLIQRGLPNCSMWSGGPDNYTTILDPPLTRYNCCLTIIALPNVTNTGAVTLDTNGRGVMQVLRSDGKQMEKGDMAANIPFPLAWCNGAWYALRLVSSQMPTGQFDLLLYITDVTANWTVPAGVTSVMAEGWGAGGGGGGGQGAGQIGGGGGGAGGEYGLGYITCKGGDVFNLTVGVGGMGSQAANTAGQGGTPTIIALNGSPLMIMNGGGPGLPFGSNGSTPGQGGSISVSGELISGSGGFVPNATWGQSGSPGGGTTRGRLYAMGGNFGLPPGGGGAGNDVNNFYSGSATSGAPGRVKITYPKTS